MRENREREQRERIGRENRERERQTTISHKIADFPQNFVFSRDSRGAQTAAVSRAPVALRHRSELGGRLVQVILAERADEATPAIDGGANPLRTRPPARSPAQR